MLSKLLAIAITVLAISGMALAAPIGTVYSENFEDDTEGSPPGPTSAPTPYWIDSLIGSGYSAPIVEWGPDVAGSGNQSQVYYDPGYVGGGGIEGARKFWRFTTPLDAPVEFTFEFDFYVRNVDTDRPIRLLFFDSDWSGYGPAIRINQSQVRFGTNPGDAVLAGTALETTWQHIDMYVNTTTNEVSVSLDGATPVSTTYTTDALVLNQLWIQRTGGNPAFFALDNFVLTVVPEPVTLALLAIGGLLALAKRRPF